MNSQFSHPQKIVTFLHEIYRQNGKAVAVVAVSGGIDSAVSLNLVSQALGADAVHVAFFPYADQSIADATLVADTTNIPEKNRHLVNIESAVAAVAQTRGISLTADNPEKVLRLGNVMARCRMILLYDLAKELDALVCGTENKSEKYLGYFTRFGDEASDIEPIQHLYKTQVRELAQQLGIPTQILEKAPSAGLWQGQTDEAELGFSYQTADRVLQEYIDSGRYLQHSSPVSQQVSEIASATGLDARLVGLVLERVNSQAFKHGVPYTVES